MNVKPYHWEHLKKISKAELALEKWYLHMAEAAGLSRQTLVDISEWLTHYLEVPWSVEPLGYAGKTYGGFLDETGPDAVQLTLSLLPLDRKCIAVVDRETVQIALARLLGGSPARSQRPTHKGWTDIEKGLVEYLFARVLSELKALGGKSELLLRLDQIEPAATQVRGLYKEIEPVIVSRFKVEVAAHRGIVEIVLPHPVLEPLSKIIQAGQGSHDDVGERRLKWCHHVPTSLWAEVGETGIGLKEFGSMQPGDILLLDRATIRMKDGLPSGHVGLRVGQGTHGRLFAELLPSAETLKVRVVS